ncbi:hypothetical protein KEJ27_09875 [Candidatus Bathyarchaeota archaeon]|nr:hypothetical protein [Candidatus Bathyarchaeota archaeon]
MEKGAELKKLTIRIDDKVYDKILYLKDRLGLRTINDTVIYCIGRAWVEYARTLIMKEVIES